MNLISTPSHSGSNEFPIIKQNSQSCLTDKLRKYALVTTSIFCSAVAIAMVAIVACGFIQPIILACLLVSLIVAGVMLVLMTRHIRDMRPVLPSGFLNVIKKEYPEALYNLIIQERLTLQELRVVLSGLSSGTFTFPSSKCQKKLERFGFERLQKACEGIQLPDLEKILLKNCPFYFVNKFIQLGPKEFPEAENMDPEIYWVCRTGLDSTYNTAFDPDVWVLAHVVTQEEYEMLLMHAKNNTWDQVSEVFIAQELNPRLRKFIETANVEGFHIDRDMLLGGLILKWLLRLCKHGVCWKQLELFKEIECKHVNLFTLFDLAARNLNIMRLMLVIAPYIDENKEGFDPFITLITWEEWIREYEQIKGANFFFGRTLKFLSKNSRKTLKDPPSFITPVYYINTHTGSRVLEEDSEKGKKFFNP
ncbi:DUF1389 domain-containing protein [Chlamydia crocodili]|uniref:DUF1389 domain-containing protein n=1 Tax=Chlamydia crocodili TaxID=2766982 RepID=A0ABX8CDS1_9CHLA|nr:DUF1389 domain-containing protein [Chlamydia crocodili]QVE49159.1 DUF1389 domain-containing protein [Chlamydia crocodili]